MAGNSSCAQHPWCCGPDAIAAPSLRNRHGTLWFRSESDINFDTSSVCKPLKMGLPSTLSTQTWILMPFFNKKNPGPLEEWLILGLGQEIYKTSLEHLVKPERKQGVLNTEHTK